MTSYWYRHTQSVRGACPFITYLNAVHPTMNSRATVRSHPFPLWMSIITDLHIKPTGKQYILHSLCHLVHTKRATSFSLALRLHRICSTDDIKRYIGETKRRPKDGLNKDHRPVSWQAYQHIRTFPRRSPRRSHSFHYGNEPQFVRHLDKERQFLPKYWTK